MRSLLFVAWQAALIVIAACGTQPQAATKTVAVNYEEVAAGEEDPLSVPLADGIVWYGTWEDAMAEKERTGKPVLLHMGSPRCPASGVNVPGTW